MDRPKNVVRAENVGWEKYSTGEKFSFRGKSLAVAAGGSRIGCTLYEVRPGRRSWPYHYHLANEEAIYVLTGTGTLRLRGDEVPIGEGDYVVLPVGEAGTHQVINTSDGPLRFLCVSTMIEPEIAVYPDSGKFGLFAGSPPGGPRDRRTLFSFLRADAEVDYWKGEK